MSWSYCEKCQKGQQSWGMEVVYITPMKTSYLCAECARAATDNSPQALYWAHHTEATVWENLDTGASVCGVVVGDYWVAKATDVDEETGQREFYLAGPAAEWAEQATFWAEQTEAARQRVANRAVATKADVGEEVDEDQDA